MAKVFIGANGYKLYLGASKIRKAYLGNQRVYSAGNVVTYRVDNNMIYQEEIDSDMSCLSPKTFTPTKTGWIFVGWREDNAASGNVLTNKTMGDEPVTLYAVFKQNLTVKLYSGTIPTSIPKTRYYNNGNILNPTCQFTQPAKTGWTARGWSTSTVATAPADYGNGVAFAITTSVTLYGLYQQTITLSTTANGKTTSYTGTRHYSTSSNVVNPKFTIANASKTGTTFLGWSNNGTSTVWKTSITNLELSANTTIYAVFKYEENVIFDGGDNAGIETYRWFVGVGGKGVSTQTPVASACHFNAIDCTNYNYCKVRVYAQDNDCKPSGSTQDTLNIYIGFNTTTSGAIHIASKTSGTSIGTYGEGIAYNKYGEITLDVSKLTGVQSLYCIGQGSGFGSGYFNVYLSKITMPEQLVVG